MSWVETSLKAVRGHARLFTTVACGGLLVAVACQQAPAEAPAPPSAGDSFATIQQVLQHPRCMNCHVPGDAPLHGDSGEIHTQAVVRGPTGHGAPGVPCSSCHLDSNAPESYGPNAPPGAPNWAMPPPEQKMAWQGLSAKELCEVVKDKSQNGNRDLDALLTHVREDPLVLWGWSPGGSRVPVSVPHAEFVAKFEQWVGAGAPCPQ